MGKNWVASQIIAENMNNSNLPLFLSYDLMVCNRHDENEGEWVVLKTGLKNGI